MFDLGKFLSDTINYGFGNNKPVKQTPPQPASTQRPNGHLPGLGGGGFVNGRPQQNRLDTSVITKPAPQPAPLWSQPKPQPQFNLGAGLDALAHAPQQFAKGVGDTLTGIAHGVARAPETLVRSVADFGAKAIDPRLNTSQTAPNTGIMGALYGSDPIKTYQDQSADLGKQLAANKSTAGLAKFAPFAAPVLALGDATAIGGAAPAVKTGIKATTALVNDVAPVVKQSLNDTLVAARANPEAGAINPLGDISPKPVNSLVSKPTSLPILGQDLNQAKQKVGSFTSTTVPASSTVSDPLKEVVAKTPSLYTGVTNQGHLEQSLSNLSTKGVDGIINDVSSKLKAPNGHIDSQTVADTLTAAQALDVKGDTASLDKAAELYDQLSKHLTASGQTTQAASLILRRSPEGLQLGAYRQLQKAGQPLTPEMRSAVQDGIAKVKATVPGTQEHSDAVAGFLQNLGKQIPQSTIKNLTGVWKAGLLSGVKTQGGNFVSNATFGALKKVSDPLAALTDQVLAVGTGNRSKTLTSRGILSGAKEGANNGLFTMKTGIDRRNIDPTNLVSDKYEQHQGINFKHKVIQKVVGDPANLVFRGMSAADQPFYYATLKNNLYDIAKADGLNQGLHGKSLTDYMKKFATNPPEQAVQTASDAAEKAVLGNDTFASNFIQGGKQRIVNSNFSDAGKAVAIAAIDRVAPFTKVPSAFLSRVIDYTPAGLIKTVASQIAKGKFDQRALSESIAEAGTGSGIIYLGSELANNGLLSGDYPNDPKEQARWAAQGITPNSVKVGNTWYSLNYLGSVGLLFGAGKNIHDAAKTGDNQAVAAAAGVGKGLLGQSFLQGFTGFGNAIQDPGRYGQNLVNSQVSSSVPAISADVANATDQYQRQANSPLEAAANRIPGLRETLKPKTDSFGNDLQQAAGGVNAAVNPLKPSNNKDTPLLNELSRLSGVGAATFPTTNKNIVVGSETVKLTPDQINKYNKDSGQRVQQAWNDMIKTPEYANLSDADKSKYLNNAMSDIQQVVKKQTLQNIGRGDLADKVKLTKNQIALQDTQGGYQTKVPSDKTTPSTDPVTRYQENLAKYQKDKKEGKLSGVQDYKAQQSLAKESITSQYSPEVQQFYGLSKAQQNAYFASDQGAAKKLYDQAKQLDAQLVNKGLVPSSKFKTAVGTTGKSGRKKGSGSGKTKVAKSKYNYAKGMASIYATSSKNQTALRNLVKRPVIKRKVIKA